MSFGTTYKYADENPRDIQDPDPFTTDPNLLDRALQLHSITQNTIANWVIGEGITPISPDSTTCDFDIAWESIQGRIVCEVKSLSEQNETHQFRIGLGQILEYSYLSSAVPVLMFSRRPKNQDLIAAAQNAGVRVLWPEILGKYSPNDLRTLIVRRSD